MPSADLRSPIRRRVVLACVAATTIAAGLVVHRFGSGIPGDVAGDALYAVLVYVLLALVSPRSPRRLIAALALIACAAVELLQLTDFPRDVAAAFPPAALVLGAGFDQRDLLVYAAAVVAAMLVDVAISRAARRRSPER
ncbi:DUF2809 domain-containing protein [Microbacterium sp. CIAB417]|uniref:DUF2809 domain-containing protein n=1 Tax=Microbacterium sp. CIAB417 TaxID=2860287 RepID=UPI001FACBAA4|nr:DUF2809 domain-containing protein [Microbacterium sp. CIAB417]